MEKPILKTFSLRVRDEKDLEVLDRFHKAAIYTNKPVSDLVVTLMDDYAKKNLPKRQTLVTANQLMERAKEEGFSTVYGSIKTYRREGLLKDKDGLFYHTNPEGKIVYVWEKVRKFLKQRNQNRYSRLKREDNGR